MGCSCKAAVGVCNTLQLLIHMSSIYLTYFSSQMISYLCFQLYFIFSVLEEKTKHDKEKWNMEI